MVSESIAQLLILQDRDARCDHMKRMLESIPHERTRAEQDIVTEEARVQTIKGELTELESRRRDLEGEVATAEERIVRYKTQQLEVKKNEEYTALEHEISTLKTAISELEDAELLLLDEIDQKNLQLSETEKAVEETISRIHLLLKNLSETEASHRGELTEAESAVQHARDGTAPDTLKQYDFVKSQVKKGPVVVELNGGRCLGCHLKVSGEVDAGARKSVGLVRCDNCGRILYYDR